TIAFPVNMREMDKINYLAGQCKLGVLVDSIEILNYLTKQIQHPVKVWVEVDAGYPRSGIPWHEVEQIQALIDEIEQSPLLRLGGLLSHFGQTYLAKSKLEIISIHREAVKRLNKLKNTLRVNAPLNISIGDTPSCSVVERFEGVDEIRPGNFVFYDLMQLELGSCVEGDISAMVACPVVSIQRQRSEIVLYGGGVHLSKEVLTDVKGQNHYGKLVEVREDGWGHLRKNCSVTSLSQEHGIVHLSDEFIEEVKVGDAVLVAPVHSCLVADLISHYYVF
ncbi:MAG: alanine racemase, partial [Calditrichaeota bacterium]